MAMPQNFAYMTREEEIKNNQKERKSTQKYNAQKVSPESASKSFPENLFEYFLGTIQQTYSPDTESGLSINDKIN